MVGASGLVLLASLFALDWYGLKGTLVPTATRLGVSTGVNGWHGLTHLRWLVLVTVFVAFALVFFQATRRSPAIPVSLSVIVTVLALLTALALIYRVLLNRPGSSALVGVRAGSIVGLASALAMIYGGYLSMRQEGIARADGPPEIEVVRLPDAAHR